MTEIILRSDQEKCIKDIQRVFRDGKKSCLLQLATGGGKTYISGSIIKRSQAKKKRCWFLCDRVALIDQTIKSFDDLGIQGVGVIAAGYKPDYSLPTQICSVQTLLNRMYKIPYVPNLIVHDEARGIAAAAWSSIYRYYNDSYHLGLDATPERGDGKALSPFFSEMVHGLSIKELIKIGALVPPRCFDPGAPDLSGIRININGEFDEDQLADYMDRPSITGSIVEHYKNLGMGRQGIVFAVNVKHSESLAAGFRAASISCVHLDAKSSTTYRDEVIESYRRGEIDLLCNVNLFSAGFDVKNVSYIADAAPKNSIAQYIQQAGRGARPLDGKSNYIYADHAGNIDRHDMLPHEDREWSLEGRKKRKKKDEPKIDKVPLRKCPKCHCSHEPEPSCPACGYEYPPQDRSVEFREGELVEVEERVPVKRWKLSEQLAAVKSVEDLRDIARKNGYKPGWMYHMRKLKGL
jgi:superfamily II DNA or RNA helicase